MGTRILLYTAVALVAGSSVATAQNWGRSTPRDGACFYEDANYRGDFFCVESGEDLASLPNDVSHRISSVRVFGSAEVRVFTENRYRGRSAAFDSDVKNLNSSNMNDRIASIRVRNGQQSNYRLGDDNNGRFGNG